MMEFQKGQIRSDFRIWENQRFVEHPPFAGGEEEHYARFRRWFRQFYQGEDGATAPSVSMRLRRPAPRPAGPG